MRWPWVSRERFERLEWVMGRKDNTIDNLSAALNHERDRFDALLDKYHALKMQGAAPVPATPTVVPPRAKDAVLEAIATVAGSNAGLRMVLGKYARQARADGVSDDRIIEELHDWPEDAEGVPA